MGATGRQVIAGVRWVRPDAFRRDVDVEPEYRELRESGSVTFELVLHVKCPKKPLSGRASYLHSHAQTGAGERAFERRVAAVVRRAAEDGFAVRVRESVEGWVGEQAEMPGRQRIWRETRTVKLAGPLSAKIADPIGALHAEAATLYDELRRKESVLCRYSGSNPLLIGDPDAVRFRELKRLAVADGFTVEANHCDDIGEDLRLVPGKKRVRRR